MIVTEVWSQAVVPGIGPSVMHLETIGDGSPVQVTVYCSTRDHLLMQVQVQPEPGESRFGVFLPLGGLTPRSLIWLRVKGSLVMHDDGSEAACLARVMKEVR